MFKIKSVVDWVDYRLPVFTFLVRELRDYPTPRNLNYFWNFGSLAGIALVVMIMSGIFLAMHYDPNVANAFNSVDHIMRDVNYGWMIRYLHMNGASMFFIVVYMHMFRGLYYGSYKSPRELLWMIGVVIYLLMMATAFMGYVLPWGQMSYWGATVITNLFSVFPFGESIVQWLWGGFSVSNPTLNRFFVLHYLLPFIIIAFVGLHLIALHQHGSNNPLGIDAKEPEDKIPFHPYYTIKDIFGVAIMGIVWASFLFFAPNFFGEVDNYIPANPLVTPAHIVPEWYFLPFYAILRSIPNKFLGVIAMFGAVGILFFLPWLDRSKVRSATFRPIYKWVYWTFVLDCFVLGVVGAYAPDDIHHHLGGISNQLLGQFATAYYFFFFLGILPALGFFEKPRPLPYSISQAVLTQAKKITALIIICMGLLVSSTVYASEDAKVPAKKEWSFQGVAGKFDRASLQRGFQVYKEVCSTCHSLKHISFRHLSALGFNKPQIKAIASDYEINDGPNDEGEMFKRKGIESDFFQPPYDNDNAARAANNGSLPPDLSLMIKARKGGADYVYALLTGFSEPQPSTLTLMPGMHFNPYFPGKQIAMAPPLVEGQVQYSDGTKASVQQMAHDVTTFLAWCAEPELEDRKRMGFRVLIYFSAFALIMYFSMKKIWSDLKLRK